MSTRDRGIRINVVVSESSPMNGSNSHPCLQKLPSEEYTLTEKPTTTSDYYIALERRLSMTAQTNPQINGCMVRHFNWHYKHLRWLVVGRSRTYIATLNETSSSSWRKLQWTNYSIQRYLIRGIPARELTRKLEWQSRPQEILEKQK